MNDILDKSKQSGNGQDENSVCNLPDLALQSQSESVTSNQTTTVSPMLPEFLIQARDFIQNHPEIIRELAPNLIAKINEQIDNYQLFGIPMGNMIREGIIRAIPEARYILDSVPTKSKESRSVASLPKEPSVRESNIYNTSPIVPRTEPAISETIPPSLWREILCSIAEWYLEGHNSRMIADYIKEDFDVDITPQEVARNLPNAFRARERRKGEVVQQSAEERKRATAYVYQNFLNKVDEVKKEYKDEIDRLRAEIVEKQDDELKEMFRELLSHVVTEKTKFNGQLRMYAIAGGASLVTGLVVFLAGKLL